MRVFSGRVRRGAIVPDGEVKLQEGEAVTVIVDAGEQSFELTPAEERELLAAIDEAERGDVVPAAELLQRLPK